MNRILRSAISGAAWGAAALAFAAGVCADVKAPAIFGSHMVLQRDQADKIWGKADPGEDVTVTIADQTKTAKADSNGRWTVTLDPLPAGGPYKMVLKGKNEIVFDDVMAGEVWLCSGQSNMEWNLGAANDGDIEALAAKDGKLRFISVPKVGVQEPKDDFSGKWQTCAPESARQFSAVGYFFGKRLRETLDVPVGLIDDSWGGFRLRGLDPPRPARAGREIQADDREMGTDREGREEPRHA